MKNLKLTAILLSIFLIVSCGDKEEIIPAAEDLIIGTWVITDATATGDINMNIGGGEVPMTFDGKNKNSDMSLSFTSDGQYITEGNLIMDVDIYIEGELMVTEEMNLIEEGVDVGGDVGNWSVENKFVILDGESANKIIFLDDNRFMMNTNNPMADLPMDGLEVDMDMNIQYTFTKQ
jgi:hypothetical protein